MASTVTLTDMSLDELTSLLTETDQDSLQEDKYELPRVEGYPPLSYAQERLVFMDRLSEGSSFYNLAYGLNVKGKLNVAALNSAWEYVVERHETLRSIFPDDEEGKPCVRFIPAEKCALQYVDLRPLAEKEQSEVIDKESLKMVSDSYSLTEGPLLRGVVLQKGDDEYTFLYGFHHSIFDGWSQAIFQNELFKTYGAHVRGENHELPALPATHGQYALWQRDKMEGTYGREESEWWKEYLSGVDDLNLITDKERPQIQSFDGDCVTFTIPREISAPLEDFAGQLQASPFMLWSAVLAILLGKYSGQKRFALGSSLAGRSHPDTESLIGFLVNNLVVKLDNDPDHSFREHLLSVQKSVLTSYDHGEYPFQLIAQSLGRHPDLSRNPVYQATLTYQNYPESQKTIEGLNLSNVSFPILTTHVDIDIVAWPTDEGVVCCMLYATDLFTRQTAEAFSGAMVDLARYLVDNPDVSLKTLLKQDFFPNISKRQPSVLIGEQDNFIYRSPWERLTEHAKSAPDAPALIVSKHNRCDETCCDDSNEEEIVSFSMLADMGAAVATGLEKRGGDNDKPTIILLYTGVELFVAMFAVWHRNGSWLLIDPDTPKARLSSILDDVSPDCIISTSEIAEKCQLDTADALSEKLHLLPEWSDISLHGERLSPVRPSADDIAMVFCTSGSTGTPKSAPCTHEAVSKRLSWEMEQYPLGKDDVACLKSSVSYADFFYEVFVPLLSGVPLLLLGHSPALDVQYLMQQIEKYKVTKLVSVPSLLKAMHRVSDGFKGRLQCLRFIRTSGEPMPTELAEAIVNAIPNVTLYSVYGALEMHNPTGFCYSANHNREKEASMYLPAGYPLPGRSVALLDEYQQPVPAGERGELYAGGWGLTPGYLSGIRKDFFPMLDINGTEERWYRSGDMGVIDTQGRLTIAGRKDFQIKVRGVRVEPEDVEGAMLQYPGVNEAKITAWEDEKENQRLYGFAVLDPAQSQAVDKQEIAKEIRSFLLDKLPPVMVPDYVTILEDWPCTATGKTHLALLKEAFRKEHAIVTRGSLPKYRGLEKDVALIWSKVLGTGHVQDAKTSFFNAGGNSLVLVTLHSELQKKFQEEFPLTVLFQNSTIESQAKFFASQSGAKNVVDPERAQRGRSALRSRRRGSRG